MSERARWNCWYSGRDERSQAQDQVRNRQLRFIHEIPHDTPASNCDAASACRPMLLEGQGRPLLGPTCRCDEGDSPNHKKGAPDYLGTCSTQKISTFSVKVCESGPMAWPVSA